MFIRQSINIFKKHIGQQIVILTKSPYRITSRNPHRITNIEEINMTDDQRTYKQIYFNVPISKHFMKDKSNKVHFLNDMQFHVLNSGAAVSAKSVIFNCGLMSYLFNSGENVINIGHACKNYNNIKKKKICNIFITHNSWNNLTGVTGAAFHMEMKGLPRLLIHGPTGVETFAHDILVYAEDAKVKVGSTQSKTEFKDNYVHIKYVPLLPEDVEKTNNPSDDDQSDLDIDNESIEGSTPAKKMKMSDFSPLSHPECVYAYILTPSPLPPRVHLEKCVELGIKQGVLVGELVRGNTVTLEDGTVVQPEQVLAPREPPKSFLVIECPSEDYLYSILNSKQLIELQNNSEKTVELVVHMSPYDIIQTPQYQQFIKRFPDSTYHLYLHEKTSGVHSQSFIQFHAELNMLHPEMFPLVHMPKQQIPDPEDEKHVLAKPYLAYKVRPTQQKGFFRESCVDEDYQEQYLKSLKESESWMKDFNDFKENVLSKVESRGPEFPEVVFLGTGSCWHTAYRTVSGILVHLDAETSLIMDCGEGTASQIEYLYGDQADEVLAKVKVLFVSHNHGDHHLGVGRVITRRQEAFKRLGKDYSRLIVTAPYQYPSFLKNNAKHFKGELKDILRFIPVESLTKSPYTFKGDSLGNSPEIEKHVKDALNCKEVLTVPVIHSKNASGLIFTHKSGYKIVYSADTMPCPALIDKGKECDLLIHEATFGSELLEFATIKKHSTFDQAVQVGRQMRAKFIMLTHFSQRYQKMPPYDYNLYEEKIGLAFDLMKVKLGDAEIISELMDALRKIYKTEFEDNIRKDQDRVYLWKKQGGDEKKTKNNTQKEHSEMINETKKKNISRKMSKKERKDKERSINFQMKIGEESISQKKDTEIGKLMIDKKDSQMEVEVKSQREENEDALKEIGIKIHP